MKAMYSNANTMYRIYKIVVVIENELMVRACSSTMRSQNFFLEILILLHSQALIAEQSKYSEGNHFSLIALMGVLIEPLCLQ